MDKKFSVLQSGFITPDNPLIIEPESISPDLINVSIKLGKTVNDYKSPYLYHKGIEEVYNDYLNDNLLIKNFDFREKIIFCLKNAIGNNDFKGWIDYQKKSDHYEGKHAAYLLDTINFIKTGNRSVTRESWMFILEATKRKTFIGDLVDPVKAVDSSVSDIRKAITHWMSHPQGVRDMLIFTKTVFGKTYIRKA